MQKTKEWISFGFALTNVVLIAGLYFGKQENKVESFGNEIGTVQAKLDNISTEVTLIKIDVARLQERTNDGR